MRKYSDCGGKTRNGQGRNIKRTMVEKRSKAQTERNCWAPMTPKSDFQPFKTLPRNSITQK